MSLRNRNLGVGWGEGLFRGGGWAIVTEGTNKEDLKRRMRQSIRGGLGKPEKSRPTGSNAKGGDRRKTQGGGAFTRHRR